MFVFRVGGFVFFGVFLWGVMWVFLFAVVVIVVVVLDAARMSKKKQTNTLIRLSLFPVSDFYLGINIICCKEVSDAVTAILDNLIFSTLLFFLLLFLGYLITILRIRPFLSILTNCIYN